MGLQRESLVGAIPPPPGTGGSGARPAPAGPPRRQGTVSTSALIVKAVLLGAVAAIAIWAAFPLVDAQAWVGLAILAVTTAGIFYLYLSPRHIPAKYLVPGTLFLIAFQIFPVLYTVSTAFTNFGDGHRAARNRPSWRSRPPRCGRCRARPSTP